MTSNATITVTLYSIVHHEGPLRTGKKYLMGDPICVTYRKIPSLYARIRSFLCAEMLPGILYVVVIAADMSTIYCVLAVGEVRIGNADL